jgi:hypothetical protein
VSSIFVCGRCVVVLVCVGVSLEWDLQCVMSLMCVCKPLLKGYITGTARLGRQEASGCWQAAASCEAGGCWHTTPPSNALRKTALSTSTRTFESFPIKGFLFEKQKELFSFCFSESGLVSSDD